MTDQTTNVFDFGEADFAAIPDPVQPPSPPPVTIPELSPAAPQPTDTTPARHLADRHIKVICEDSGIPLDFAQRLGIYTAETADDLPEGADAWWAKHVPGIVFPLPSVAGTTLYQFRPDIPVPILDDEHKPTGKSRKYLQPSGSGSHLTVYPMMLDRLADPSVRLCIVEGTKQTVLATALAPDDTCVIGMQGCWGWSSGGVPSDDFKALRLTNRDVVAGFDADMKSNPDVHASATRLKEVAGVQGARRVAYISVPSGRASGIDAEMGAKWGLDDYLAKAFDTLDDRRSAFANFLTKAKTGLGRPPAKPKAPSAATATDSSEGPAFVDEQTGTIHRPDRKVAALGVTIPGEMLLDCAPRIVQTIVHLDDDDPDFFSVEHVVEVEVENRIHQVRVADAALSKVDRWLERLSPDGSGTNIARASGRNVGDEIANAIRTHRAKEIERHLRYQRTGWVVDGDENVYLHAGGAIGPDGETGRMAADLSGMEAKVNFPDPATDPDLPEAIRRSMSMTEKLHDPTAWYAIIGALALAHTGSKPDGALYIHGKPGTGKSSICGAGAAHLAPIFADGKVAMANMEGSTIAIAESGSGLHQTVVFTDDVHPEADEREKGRQMKGLDSLIRKSYSGDTAGCRRRQWNQDTGRTSSAYVAQTHKMLVVNGEFIPTGAAELRSMLQRVLAVEITDQGSWVEGGSQAAARDGKDGWYQRAMAGYIRWIAVLIRQLNEDDPHEAWETWLKDISDKKSAVEKQLRPSSPATALSVPGRFLPRTWSASCSGLGTRSTSRQWRNPMLRRGLAVG